tara:strand:- start:520 stop:756 length:237 start_codon:yes stop_codon:yes gene_type:complete
MIEYKVLTEVTVQVEFTVEARDEDSACKKVNHIFKRNDWFDLLEAKKQSVKDSFRAKDVTDGPYNVLDNYEVDCAWPV